VLPDRQRLCLQQRKEPARCIEAWPDAREGPYEDIDPSRPAGSPTGWTREPAWRDPTLPGHAPPDSLGESLRFVSRRRWVGSGQPPKRTSESPRSLSAIGGQGRAPPSDLGPEMLAGAPVGRWRTGGFTPSRRRCCLPQSPKGKVQRGCQDRGKARGYWVCGAWVWYPSCGTTRKSSAFRLVSRPPLGASLARACFQCRRNRTRLEGQSNPHTVVRMLCGDRAWETWKSEAAKMAEQAGCANVWDLFRTNQGRRSSSPSRQGVA
jgi:hypothetical protein